LKIKHIIFLIKVNGSKLLKNMPNENDSKHKKFKNRNNKNLYDNIKYNDKKYLKDRSAYLNIISENIHIPGEIIRGTPKLTIIGRSELYFENQKRILEYTNQCICIQTSVSIIRVEGKDMKIAYCTDEEMKITGIIKDIIYS